MGNPAFILLMTHSFVLNAPAPAIFPWPGLLPPTADWPQQTACMGTVHAPTGEQGHTTCQVGWDELSDQEDTHTDSTSTCCRFTHTRSGSVYWARCGEGGEGGALLAPGGDCQGTELANTAGRIGIYKYISASVRLASCLPPRRASPPCRQHFAQALGLSARRWHGLSHGAAASWRRPTGHLGRQQQGSEPSRAAVWQCRRGIVFKTC